MLQHATYPAGVNHQLQEVLFGCRRKLEKEQARKGAAEYDADSSAADTEKRKAKRTAKPRSDRGFGV
jgi:hypothetical protein